MNAPKGAPTRAEVLMALRVLLAPILRSETWGDDVRDGKLRQDLDEDAVQMGLDVLARAGIR